MKSFNIKILIFSLFPCLFIGCKEELYNIEDYKPALAPHYLFLKDMDFKFSSSASTEESKIQSTDSWSFSEIPSWITISPSEGDSSAEISITASENKSLTSREAVFFLKSTDSPIDLQRTVTVSQYGGRIYFKYPDGDEFSVDGKTHHLDVKIETNVEDVKITTDVDWLTASYNADTNTVSIDLTQNGANYKRTGYIYLESLGTHTFSWEKGSIEIIQLASEIEVGETINFDAEGGTQSRVITSDVPWTAECGSSWIDISPINGNVGETTVTLSVAPSYKNDSRNSYVRFDSEESIKKFLDIYQKGRYINISQESISLSSDENTTKTISVESNIGWMITTCPDWLEVSPTSGESGNSEITIKASKNNSLNSRSGTLEICDSYSGGIKQTINVDQTGVSLDYNYVMKFGWKESSLPLNVPLPSSWKAEASQEWIHLSEISGNGEKEIIVNVDQNKEEDLRQGKIIFNCEGKIFEIEVIQEGQYIKLDKSTGEVGVIGGKIQFSLSTSVNTHWNIEYKSQEENWIEVQEINKDDSQIKEYLLTVSENHSIDSRNAIFNIISDDIDVNDNYAQGVKFYIKQLGRNISCDTSKILMTANEGISDEYKISADGKYSICKKEDADWFNIIYEPARDSFYVKVEYNESENERIGYILLLLEELPEGETFSREIELRQCKRGVNIMFDNFEEEKIW